MKKKEICLPHVYHHSKSFLKAHTSYQYLKINSLFPKPGLLWQNMEQFIFSLLLPVIPCLSMTSLYPVAKITFHITIWFIWLLLNIMCEPWPHHFFSSHGFISWAKIHNIQSMQLNYMQMMAIFFGNTVWKGEENINFPSILYNLIGTVSLTWLGFLRKKIFIDASRNSFFPFSTICGRAF